MKLKHARRHARVTRARKNRQARARRPSKLREFLRSGMEEADRATPPEHMQTPYVRSLRSAVAAVVDGGQFPTDRQNRRLLTLLAVKCSLDQHARSGEAAAAAVIDEALQLGATWDDLGAAIDAQDDLAELLEVEPC